MPSKRKEDERGFLVAEAGSDVSNHEGLMISYEDARAKLVDYIHDGVMDKTLGIRVVGVYELRRLLLDAGYTELAIGRWFGTSVHKASLREKMKSDGFEDWQLDERGVCELTQEELERQMSFKLREGNRYGMDVGWHYFSELPLLLDSNPPDFEEGFDVLRGMLLSEFTELNELKVRLTEEGLGFNSLKSWHFCPDQTAEGSTTMLKFLLNPVRGDLYQHGWYSIAELEQWVNRTGPVCKK